MPRKKQEVKVFEENVIEYEIKEGDTIQSIGDRFGIYWKKLYALNKFIIGNNPNKLKAGTKIILG